MRYTLFILCLGLFMHPEWALGADCGDGSGGGSKSSWGGSAATSWAYQDLIPKICLHAQSSPFLMRAYAFREHIEPDEPHSSECRFPKFAATANASRAIYFQVRRRFSSGDSPSESVDIHIDFEAKMEGANSGDAAGNYTRIDSQNLSVVTWPNNHIISNNNYFYALESGKGTLSRSVSISAGARESELAAVSFTLTVKQSLGSASTDFEADRRLVIGDVYLPEDQRGRFTVRRVPWDEARKLLSPSSSTTPEGHGVSSTIEGTFTPPDEDSDADLLTDMEEMTLGTNPFNPDTDGDGHNDKEEVDAGTDPLDPNDPPPPAPPLDPGVLIMILSNDE